ncbi:MAG TPA: Ig domain-containing protein [Candidatus Limivivens merdigallinarum]|uniref:Ig domain-containing protein n=1 Tax=Candidatus Limivivens merdigallinarum TaxID=2840859 RepID=A0A9D1D0B7_9FIRM|nr:Ig domain-containing protein [Candidatus Limivivens merdigallinarum]
MEKEKGKKQRAVGFIGFFLLLATLLLLVPERKVRADGGVEFSPWFKAWENGTSRMVSALDTDNQLEPFVIQYGSEKITIAASRADLFIASPKPGFNYYRYYSTVLEKGTNTKWKKGAAIKLLSVPAPDGYEVSFSGQPEIHFGDSRVGGVSSRSFDSDSVSVMIPLVKKGQKIKLTKENLIDYQIESVSGKAVVQLYHYDLPLTEGLDYQVTWSAAKNGFRTAVITGKGNYTGKITTDQVAADWVSAGKGTSGKAAKLNKQRATVYKGKSMTLRVTGTAGKVIWKSSKTSVASVNGNGKVTAKRAGTASITAKVNGKVYRCKVTVKNPSLNKTKLSLKEGRSYSLKLNGASVKSFKSSNPRVASVNRSGKVTAKKAGNATIICTAKNRKTYRCRVTVSGSSSSKGKLTESRVYRKIIAQKDTYKEGRRWTNKNYYDWKGGIYDRGYGCAGFAFLLSDAAFGDLPARKHRNFSKIKVGDIVRLEHDRHSVIVLKKEADGVIVAEGNYDDSIHWGRKLLYSEIRKTGTYVFTRYPK